MDNILNYQSAISAFDNQVIGAKNEAEEKAKEARDKLKELTDPFEQLGIDDFSDLFKMGVKSVGKGVLSKL